MLIVYRISQAADQQVALCTHAEDAAEQFVANNQHMVDPKAAQWPAAAAVLVTSINVAHYLHVVFVFAVCTATASNQVCAV
jgi:hypothetical protein